MFKRRRFPFETILLSVRWYCKYGISYRDLVELMQERGVEVYPSTIMRWVYRLAPELEKWVRWYQGYRATSWRVGETYVKVGGRRKDLFRAVDKHGRLIEFLLADRRTLGIRQQSRACGRPRLPGFSKYHGCLTTTINEFSHQGLHRMSEDERTVTTACLKPVSDKGPHTAEAFQKTGTRHSSSWPGEYFSTNRPQTLKQTFSR